MRRLVLAACAAAALAVPAHAGPPSVPDTSPYVTVEFQGAVDCVTYPCPQPMPVVVCAVPAALCTPR